MEYPKELHDLHKDYPLAPENIQIADEMLSDYSRKIKDKYFKNINSRKLVPHLMKREKYVVHMKNLLLYTKLGMKVTKVHRALEFTQTAFLEPYIRFNTEQRKKAKNDFEKDFFKLMNNSVFGKTMENLRKRISIKVITEKDKLHNYISKPSFKGCKIFNEELAIHRIKENLVLNTPCYVGFSILELSKTLMYDFHYNFIKKKFKNTKLLMSDTDSLMYYIEPKSIYKTLLKYEDKFDSSDYPKDS